MATSLTEEPVAFVDSNGDLVIPQTETTGESAEPNDQDNNTLNKATMYRELITATKAPIPVNSNSKAHPGLIMIINKFHQLHFVRYAPATNKWTIDRCSQQVLAHHCTFTMQKNSDNWTAWNTHSRPVMLNFSTHVNRLQISMF